MGSLEKETIQILGDTVTYSFMFIESFRAYITLVNMGEHSKRYSILVWDSTEQYI